MMPRVGEHIKECCGLRSNDRRSSDNLVFTPFYILSLVQVEQKEGTEVVR